MSFAHPADVPVKAVNFFWSGLIAAAVTAGFSWLQKHGWQPLLGAG